MRAYWNEKKSRWIASCGSGKSRIWAECKTPGPAGQARCEAKIKLKTDGPDPVAPGSLAEFIEVSWWPTIRHKAPGTIKRYRGICNQHLAPLQPLPIDAMRFDLIQRFVNQLSDAKKPDGSRAIHPKSVSCIYGVLTSILGLAFKTRRLSDDSYRHVQLPPIPRRKVATLATSEVRRFLDHLSESGHAFEGPVWAAVFLGLRRGEALGLKRSDITLHQAMASIDIKWNRDEDGDREKLKNKDEGEARTLFIPREWGEKLLGFCPDDSIYLFTEDGLPVDPPRLTKQTPKLAMRAGIRRTTYKTLRATCNTVLQASGVDTKMRMSMLGHASEGVQDHYLGENAETMARAFKALEQAI